uniref:Myosin-IB (inferred by orthology to a D. melanogaster protein) n=1 Tax=Strongyloides venezuelensis TaxID=75913 RepID=A0A0K0F7H5_STRVS
MVLLTTLSDQGIVDNLKKRLRGNSIFTYIGPVLISVNPFKDMGIFTDKEIEIYQGANIYENPPHIYALIDNIYRNMDSENHQCVIISGESGAGKTFINKQLINYISKVSGGGVKVQKVKDVILQSNPLLEAFGNSATLRNWNSSRFGKYIEILFDSGQPIGGKITNLLLEKSRVVRQIKGERNFHIFYQLLFGCDDEIKRNFGITNVDYFNYLNQSGLSKIEGTDDRKEFEETMRAMEIVGIPTETQLQILQLLSAILHIGNMEFVEENNYAKVVNQQYLEFPAFLLGLPLDEIENKITQRIMESKWGKTTEQIKVTLNVEQAKHTRDALSKAMYSRLFDYLVQSVNKALVVSDIKRSSSSIGILDIYGFEIFDNNGFEQFCINFVNEKLQQIFIELTLKGEQEEYVAEGIHWTPIEYFNNKVVCDLIESKRPPGVMSILDDICSQVHGQSEGVDEKFLTKLTDQMRQHPHYVEGANSFIVKHYAGDVRYEVNGFCERNRDVLNQDLIQLMQMSEIPFFRSLFPEDVSSTGAKAKPTSFSLKIKTQAKQLVDSLMKCTPHYVRCIKPNESKKALDFESDKVLHQVQYLGLKENIRVRRAGFAYRNGFDKFLWRYAILTSQTWPKWNGDIKKGCEIICTSCGLENDQFQLGRNKIFIKNPASLFLLEEMRERKYDKYARIIQKALKKFTAAKRYLKMKEEACNIMYGKKERRRFSINRNFIGDYVGLEYKPELQTFVGRREKIDFATTLKKYNRKFKSSELDLVVTSKEIILIGKVIEKKGINKGKLVNVEKRRILYGELEYIGLSPFQDNFIIIQVTNNYTSLLETPLKTEMITAIEKRYKEKMNGRNLPLTFKHNFEIKLKKLTFVGGGTRIINFALDNTIRDNATMKVTGKSVLISVGSGLPNTTKPTMSDATNREKKNCINNPVRDFNKNIRNQTNNHDKPYTHIHSISNTSGIEEVHRPVKPPKPVIAAKPKITYVQALYPYEAQDTSELSFEIGQKIQLIEKHVSQWWLGRLPGNGGKTGLFPANYVEEL